LGERFARLGEQLAIITGLWETPIGETFSFPGKHYQVTNSPALPKPVQSPRPPVLIGGGGKVRTPQLAAKFAQEFNMPFNSLEETAAQFDRVREACERHGRGRESIILSAAQVLCVGENEAEIERRAQRIGREVGELRANGLAGTVDEVVEKIQSFAKVGARRMYLQMLDLSDLDHLRLVAERITPQVN
jgi:alkanesulfonate monooxygenase SsuD/methylene tetrahydromethanopterin reductase-like flavin-dependent oxidoreductase (luciferase family)